MSIFDQLYSVRFSIAVSVFFYKSEHFKLTNKKISHRYQNTAGPQIDDRKGLLEPTKILTWLFYRYGTV